jgi:hypothetical protein
MSTASQSLQCGRRLILVKKAHASRLSDIASKHAFDELRLAGDVRLSIAGIQVGQRALQFRIRVTERGIGTEGVAETEVANPVGRTG